jgi:F0F1-type ATP synthase assembly protein I
VSDEQRPEDETPSGGDTREPPLVAFGIVAGTAVGLIAGLLVGHFALGAGIGCAAGLVIGAVAQLLRSRS